MTRRMGLAKVPPMTYADRLRKVMADKGVSVRELGKRLRPDSPETGRRTVQKYLAAVNPDTPGEARRKEFAAALGAPELDEEEDLVATLTHALELARAALKQRERSVA